MQLGMIGLGRMGANIVRRLMRASHACVVFDKDPAAVAGLAKEGAVGAESLADLVAKLAKPRAVWIMLPAGEITQNTLNAAERPCSRPATSSSTAATPSTRTTSAAPARWPNASCTMSTSAPAAACGGSSAAIA